MAILTVAQVKEHVETDLGSDAIQRLIDDADAEIIDRLGALATETDVLDGGTKVIHLTRKAQSITSVVERILETNYSLAASDYSLLSDGRRIERLTGAGYPSTYWNGRVTVVYVPADETASRKRLLIDLVKLAVNYSGHGSYSVGDVRIQSLSDYQKERARLFEAILERNRRWIA